MISRGAGIVVDTRDARGGFLRGSMPVGAALLLLSFPLAHALADTTHLCGQKVDYSIERSEHRSDWHAYFGAWTGDAIVPDAGYSGLLCVGFVMESMTRDGTVTARFAWADGIRYPNGYTLTVRPGVSRLRGKRTGDTLLFVGNDGYFRLELRPNGNALLGDYTTRKGKGDVRLTRP